MGSMRRSMRRNGNVKTAESTVRNGRIDLYKFLFAVVVAVYHFSCSYDGDDLPFTKGYMAVEFFFIVSGFFFAKSLDRVKEEEWLSGTLKYSKRKYMSIFPYHLFSLIFVFAYTFYEMQSNLKEAMLYFVEMLPNVFLFQIMGFGNLGKANHEWYLSAMLVVMFILAPLAIKLKDKFFCWVALIVAFFTLGYLENYFGGSINAWYQYNGIICLGMLRAFAEICLGCVVYAVYKSGILNKLKKSTMLILEGLCLAYVLIYLYGVIETKLDYVTVFVIAALVALVVCPKSSIEFLNNKATGFMGKLSMALYLFLIFFCYC